MIVFSSEGDIVSYIPVPLLSSSLQHTIEVFRILHHVFSYSLLFYSVHQWNGRLKDLLVVK